MRASPIAAMDRVQLVRDLKEYSGRGEEEILVPAGEYIVGAVASRKVRWFGRSVWWVRFRITDVGEHHGRELFAYWNVIPRGSRVSRSYEIAKAYVIATALKPPKHLAQLSPMEFLGGCLFRAKVDYVRRDTSGVERPIEASYSKVDFLIERVAGNPPCLVRRQG